MVIGLCFKYKQTVRQLLLHAAMPIPEVEAILGKYKEDDCKIQHLLAHLQCDAPAESSEHAPEDGKMPLADVLARNKELLRSLETAKANLRSKAIFSPSEMQWERIYHNYKQCAALPVVTYKCHMPVLV